MRYLVVTLLSLHSSCGAVEGYDCPEVDYVPIGPAISDACECQDGVAFSCGEVCAAPGLTCEPVESINEFLAGACATCVVFLDSEVYFGCGYSRY